MPPTVFKRKWVKNRNTKTLNFVFWPDLYDDTFGDYCLYTIYEADPFPTGGRTTSIAPPGTSSEYIFYFRSADPPFITDYVDTSEACQTPTRITSCIEVNMHCAG